MASFRGTRVSAYWKTVLDAAWADGVRFQINSGQRTMAEQQALVDQKGVWSPSNPHGAAVPSPTAPHIREGRQDHALDVDTFRPPGGQTKLRAWLEHHGARITTPVPGEPWHMEINPDDLRKLHARFSDALWGYPEDEKRWIREYDVLRRDNKKPARRMVLRIVMRMRRESIYRAANKTGWNKLRRYDRWNSLRARS